MGLPKYISHSQLDVGKCPHRYDMVYIQKKYKAATGLGVQIGGFVHAIVKDYVKECVGKELDGDIEIMEKVFAKRWENYKLPEDYYKGLYDQMLGFGEKNINYDNVLDVEKEFMIEFDKGKFIKGYIDIVRTYLFRGIEKKHNEPYLCIIDYKNQANIIKQDEILTPQLKIYTLACMLLYPGYKWFRRGIYFTKYNFIRFYEDEDSPTSIADIKIEVEETREMLKREWKKLRESKEYPCKQGEWCYAYDGCPVLLDGKCPVQDIDVSVEGWIRQVWKLNTILKSLKARIKSYITANGNIILDGNELGYVKKKSEEYKLVPVIDICKEVPIPLINELNMGKTDMKSIIKEIEKKVNSPDILKKLEEYHKVEPYTKYELKEKK